MAIEVERGETIVINVSTGDEAIPTRKLKGQIEDFAKGDLRFLADEEIAVEAAITAQSKDLLFMANVVNCVPRSGPRWEVSAKVTRTLLVV